MAWNEPGDNQNNPDNERDPWLGRKKKSTKPKDLDDALNQLQKKFSNLMKKKASGNNSDDPPGGSGLALGAFFGAVILFAALIVIWAITGFFVVQPPEKAVILRFGEYNRTIGPGLHWIPRLIDSETKVNVQKIYTYTYPNNQDALMLTQDQNIVAVAITVQFKVNNPRNFLFNAVNPINSLHQATASALRQVIGQTNIDDILTTGREKVRQEVKTQLEQTLQRYRMGLQITSVLLKSAQAPEAVKDAFDDAVKAQEDEKRYINQAQAYAMKVEPIAKGRANRILAAAKAYQQQIVLTAKANIAPFVALLPEYAKNPNLMRERLYLDTLQTVLEHSSKILIDNGKNANHNLLYLPLQALLAKENIKSTVSDTANQNDNSINESTTNENTKSTNNITSTPSSTSLRPSRDNINFSYGDLGGN